ncbi:MAG: calcium-binding protein, partial [Burkholderiales bacterium]|nr:calcium-binding protein [Burkholderiales bacterium]
SQLLFLLGMGTAAGETLNGGTGSDLLNGAAGNDTLNGGGGNDSLYGGTGNDSLDGGDGDDILEGGVGDDTTNGGYGSNTFVFGRGDGSDRLYYNYNGGQARTNALQFKAGIAPADVIVRQAYDNYFGGNRALELSIAGTADKVSINGFFYNDDPANAYAGIQKVRFADGTEWTANQIVTMLLAGTAGDDNLRGTSAADTITGGAGNDTLNGAGGDDTVSGGTGNDSLIGEAGADQLFGNDGDDSLDGGDGNDTLEGGAGSDTLNAGYGSNTFTFGRGDGQDRLYYNYNGGQARTNVLVFKAGIVPGDIVVKQAYDNYFGGNRALELGIAGTADKVSINGFFYNDDPANGYAGIQRVRFADGTEWDAATLLSLLFAGTSGDDNVRGTSGTDVINGGTGNDSLNGAGGDDIVSGGAGNDSLAGEAGADQLLGGDGDDSLDGGDGDDTLDGGAGNDTLNGGYGSNTFLFGRGDGQDRLYYNYNGGQARTNTLQLRPGVLPGDVTVRQAYDNYFGGNRALEVSIAGTTDKITVNGFFYNDDPANNYNGLQKIRFDDGTEWNIAAILARVYTGTEGDDVFRGTSADESFYGLGGNDSITGAGGNDLIDGGTGNDSLSGEDGDDTVIGGAGNDSLSGGAGKDLLQGGDGDDGLDGGDGDDTLDGGAGNDTLNAGYGNNTFLFGRGDGQDRLYYNHNGGVTTRVNTLQFKAGVAPADVIVKQAYDNYFGGNNNALELSIAGTTDKVTVNAFFYSDNPANNYNGLQKVRFDDGTEWDIAALLAKVQTFTDGDDNVRGTIADDVFNGGLGNDSIAGAAGNDLIDGGAGNDNLSGDDGDDSVSGGTGNDSVSGGNGVDLLDGGDGNDSISGGAGNDQIYGGAGDDSIDGGDGDDLIDGGVGNDTVNAGYGNNTFLFGRGDGQDRLYYNHNGGVTTRVNTLQFKAGIAPADVIVKQAYDNYFGGNNNALELSIAGTTDKVTVNAFFYTDNPANNYNGLTKVRFDDGTEWTVDDIVAKLLAGTPADDNVAGTYTADQMHGGAGNDTLAGRGGDDTLYGEEGNDTLYGEDGNDTLVGGAGNDYLDGGPGNNTYVFGRGDGQDSIAARYDTTTGKLNTLQFRADVLPGDVSVRRVYESQSGGMNGLELAIVGSNDRITANFFLYGDDPGNYYNQLQQVKFADGTVWNLARLIELMNAGSEANDNLRGTNGTDTMTGGR